MLDLFMLKSKVIKSKVFISIILVSKKFDEINYKINLGHIHSTSFSL